MKPERIFLVRHGESTGNVDSSVYETTPDWKIPLTPKGQKQAKEASRKLFKKMDICKELECYQRFSFHDHPLLAVYCSPWYRARQTAAPFVEKLHSSFEIPRYTYKEDPRIREQDWGNYRKDPWSSKINRERNTFGSFFYRMPFGESGADVFDRVSTFNETFHRDFQKEDFPKNVVIFTHGCTLRIFLMRWFHWTVEEFQNVCNPSNCKIVEMRLHDNKYELITKLSKRDPDFVPKKPWESK